jgi:hypothetical protein
MRSSERALADPGSQALVLRHSLLAERTTNRLLALGYERIQVLNDADELAALEDGEVRVEALREGVVCKGRVLVRAGHLAEVEMRTAHGMFP